MILISIPFVLLILPISLLLYWLLFRTPNLKLWFLCVLSLAFYAMADPRFLPLLIGLSLATYWLALRGQPSIGIFLNLFALLLFKVIGFGVRSSLIPLLNANTPLGNIFAGALPLGISFYVFKHLGYLLDVRAKRYPATPDLLGFLTFSAFFPQITSGPVSSFDNTGRQLRNLPRQLGSEQARSGLLYISMGLAKKLLIADVLARTLDSTLYTDPMSGHGWIWAWLSLSIYAMQIYFDFSGYTDLVIGIGTLFGLTLPPNFNNPYLASSPSQFWQRWHMSLSGWFRVYLFIPISRSFLKSQWMKNQDLAQFISNLMTMVLIGLWHGIGWGFILWGAYHGILLSAVASIKRRWPSLSLPTPIATGLMFMAVLLGWALFLSPNLGFMRELFINLAGLNGSGHLSDLSKLYDPTALITLVVAFSMVISGLAETASLPQVAQRPIMALLFGLLFVVALLQLGTQPINFVYVQF